MNVLIMNHCTDMQDFLFTFTSYCLSFPLLWGILTVKKWKHLSLSHFQIFVTPGTVAHQASLSTEFSRQEYWKWVAIPFARESSWPRDQNQVSCNAGRFFTIGATREAQSFALPSLRFKFRTFRLWDWHAACWAKEATLSRDPINCKLY